MRFVKYLSIPYKRFGRGFGGADCIGLVILFYKEEFSIELPEISCDYSAKDWWKTHNYFIDSASAYNFSLAEKVQFGNIILFNSRGKFPGHCGIVLDNDFFIHMDKECSITKYSFGPWHNQINSIYTYKDLRNL